MFGIYTKFEADSLIFLLAVVAAFGIVNRKNRYSFILMLNLSSLLLMLFFGTLYIIKVQYYPYLTNVDYNLYLKIAEIKLPISGIRNLYNVSFALYMFSNVYAFKALLNIKWKQVVWIYPFIVLYVMINSSSWAITAEVNRHGSMLLRFITAYQDIISFGILIGCSLLPVIAGVISYRRVNFRIKKRDIFTFVFCIAIITAYIYIVFVFGIFKKIMFWNVNPIGLPKIEIAAGNYLSVTIFTFFILFVTVMILIIFKPFNLFAFEYN